MYTGCRWIYIQRSRCYSKKKQKNKNKNKNKKIQKIQERERESDLSSSYETKEMTLETAKLAAFESEMVQIQPTSNFKKKERKEGQKPKKELYILL